MRMTKIISIVTLFLSVTTASGQSILQDYFKGNKDSMVIEATKLINMPEPSFNPSQPTDIDPEAIKEMGFEQVYKSEDYFFTVRDKKKIFAYKFPKKSDNTIILIHGVASTGYLYNKTAGLLQEATQAEVFAIDLRGHGKSDGKDGDVDYINQYADDLADIVSTIRKQKPKGKIIIAGHSMGGGVALNYAIQKNKDKIDGFILFAPLIGNNSPAIQQTSPAENNSIEPFMKIHFARIIGLKMFNEIGDHSHDSLPILFLNLPENVPSRKYTFRANMSMAPEDYIVGLKSLNVPALVLIGTNDEVFNSEVMKKVVNENCSAQVQIINGATHNGVRHNPESYKFINNWYANLLRLGYNSKNNQEKTQKVKLNWEFGIGQSSILNTTTLKNRLNTEFQPLSFKYYFSVSLPVVKNYDRFGFKIGIGPHSRVFGLNKVISETNNRLTFMEIPDSTNIKTSTFQQFLIELPFSLYFDTPKNKNSRFISFEWGAVFGIQAYNKWKTYAKSDNIVTTMYKENIGGTENFQLGHSFKMALCKERKAISSKFFLQGTYYSTNIFKSISNSPTNSYDIKIGLQITARNII